MDYAPTMTKKELLNNVDNMTSKEIYIETKKQLIETQDMLIKLLEKWHDKDYNLTDDEWETIKNWESFLDTIFNDKNILKELVEMNKKDIKEYTNH